MSRTFFIIPGNPSVAYFYQEWIKELKEKSNDEFHYHSFPIFSDVTDPSEYMDHMISFYERKLKECNTSDITIIGHSIGAYLGMRVSQRNPDLISGLHMLFPFLGDTKISAKLMLELGSILNRAPGLGKTIHKHRMKVFNECTGFQHIKHEEIYNSMRLAHMEKLYFKKQSNIQIPENIRDKTHFYFNKDDRWCPSSTVKRVSKVINTKQVNASHEFIIIKKERQEMIEFIL